MHSENVNIAEEFQNNQQNGHVGSKLVLENNKVRVWHIHMKPGERLPVHCHQLDYFWTVHVSGKASSHFDDGSFHELSYEVGETKHFTFSPGERFMHDLENIGDNELIFTTVEFLDSANPPLKL